jgi:hypothetical protein
LRTQLAVLAFVSLSFLLVALPVAGAAPPAPPPLACVWNHQVVHDQYVTYSGYATVTVGVRFLDGSPLCQVQVVCGGEINGNGFVCVIPPLP